VTDRATKQRLFRSAALQQLASPEQLDQLITVTHPRAWLSIAALWLGLAALVIWSVSGHIATRVAAQGILLEGSLVDVTPAWGGQVHAMHVQPGDTVQREQLVATVDQPELVTQLRNQEARLRELRVELQGRTAAAQQLLTVQRRYFGEQERQLETSAREQELVVRALLARFDGERGLLDRGLLSQETALVTQQTLNTARDALARTRADLTQLGATRLAAETGAQQSLIPTQQAVSDAEREVRRLGEELARRSRVLSPSTGVVLERAADAGDLLTAGQAVARLRLLNGPTAGMRAVLYVAGGDAKRVRAGMEVQIAPSNVRSEEHGYLLARVRRVTELPAGSQTLRQALRNDALINSVSTLPSPFQVDADLIPNDTAVSGYRWTSRPGPETRLEPGTPATALIIVERRRPIAIVVPALRRLFDLQ
jgi:HlyD family secretion protein